MKFKIVLSLLMLVIMVSACSDKPNSPYKENKHYFISSAHKQSSSPQIVKFVSFACPACRGMEDILAGYQPQENVTYERFQVRFGKPSYDQLMRAYATLRALNIHDQLADELFVAIQDESKYLGDKHNLAIWVNRILPKISMESVKNAYDHSKTAELVNMYHLAEQRYQIRKIPNIWVNGNIQINLQSMEGETPEEKGAFLKGLLDHLTSKNK